MIQMIVSPSPLHETEDKTFDSEGPFCDPYIHQESRNFLWGVITYYALFRGHIVLTTGWLVTKNNLDPIALVGQLLELHEGNHAHSEANVYQV